MKNKKLFAFAVAVLMLVSICLPGMLAFGDDDNSATSDFGISADAGQGESGDGDGTDETGTSEDGGVTDSEADGVVGDGGEATDPTEGETSTDPEQPGEVVEPTDSEQPGEVVEPTDPEQPGEVVEPTDPEQPGEVVEPTDPEQPGEVVEPTDPEQPGEVVEPTDPEQPGEVVEPTDPEQPGEVVEPTDPEQPGEVVEPTDPEQPSANSVVNNIVASLGVYNRAMACTTIDELYAVLDGMTEDEFNALTDTEKLAITAKVQALEPQPLPEIVIEPTTDVVVPSEIYTPAKSYTEVAPFGDPVTGE